MNTKPTAQSELGYREALADRLALAIDAIGLPQGEVAASIGVSQQRLSNWTGRRNYPDWYSIAKFCVIYGVSADWLLLGDEGGLRVSMAAGLASASRERSAARTARRRRSGQTA